MGEESWNSVSVYGPDTDIVRFRRSCIELPDRPPYRTAPGWNGLLVEISYRWLLPAALGSDRRYGAMVDAFDYRGETTAPGQWHCSFDTRGAFPEWVFTELAAIFPRLAFDCECIDSMDDFMGFGWFNPPSGGEPFRQDMDVPPDYWTGGGAQKRSPTAAAAHAALVDALVRAAII